jgi:flagellar assembly protein FliH
LSKLIKQKDNPLYRIELFEAEDMSQELPKEEDLKERLANIEKEAYEKGFEQGRKDSLALEEKILEEKSKQLDVLLSALGNLKGEIFNQTEQELLKLSTRISRKLIGEEIKTGRGIIENTIRSALGFLVDTHHIRILLNPADMEDVKRLLPDIAAKAKGGRFQLVEDHAIAAGGCILETGFGRINATIEDQMEELDKVIEQELRMAQGECRDALP